MLLFNDYEVYDIDIGNKFKYISCYCSTKARTKTNQNEINLNTSHVIVQQIMVRKKC